MKLQRVRIKGYKRFEERSSLDTRGKVIAIVGRNEAGKTSLLRAMVHLSNGEPFAIDELTDRRPRDGEDRVIEALFTLEDGDRAELGELVAAGTDVSYERVIYVNGDVRYRLTPEFPRDRTLRARSARDLGNAVARGWLNKLDDSRETTPDEVSLADRARALSDALNSQADELGEAVTDEAGALASAVEEMLSDDALKSLRTLVESLRETASFERELPPAKQIAAVLGNRVPDFLLFGAVERELHTEYAWSEHPMPPAALANLFALADLDYAQLREASVADDRATRDTLLEVANANLDRAFQEWNQAEVHVALSPDRETLQLMVRDRAAATRTRLDDRSDGLLSFVALIAFVATRTHAIRPVLLIDEAETHLHYAAQADLVRVFERQQAAETVIYTTHSIGCLPEDLGASIRAVSPVEGQLRRSTIRNSIWSGVGSAGFTPMMLAMGANALAFTPSRRAVIGEGRCEAILLPRLIRETQDHAARDQPLGYQVVPGVSEVHPDEAADLELEAGAVAYLIDGDAGGRVHRRKLPERAKREGRVVVLGERDDDGVSIEDLVRADVLVEAFRRVVKRRRPDIGDVLTSADLPDVGRAGVLDELHRSHLGGEPLAKVELAQEALDIGRDLGGLVEPTRIALVRDLHRRLFAATEPPEAAP